MTLAPKVVLQSPVLTPAALARFVEECLRDGVELIAIAGPGCEELEDVIDDLVVGDGTDDSRFVVTSSHPGEPLEEVVEFAEMWTVKGRNDRVQFVRL